MSEGEQDNIKSKRKRTSSFDERHSINPINVLPNILNKENHRDVYLGVVEDIMYSNKVETAYGYNASMQQVPLHRATALGYLTSSLRQPSVLEKWNPYEIAVFEASIFLFGKQFHQIKKTIKTKSVKEVIEFYYEWKKSKHYQVWKKAYIPDDRDTPTVLDD